MYAAATYIVNEAHRVYIGTDEAAGGGGVDRGIFAGGWGNTNAMEYLTISTTGNGTDFGDLTTGRDHGPAGCASSTRACFYSGYNSGSNNTIDYVTVATTGNATDFGDANTARHHIGANGLGSETRGVVCGGNT